MPPKPSKADQLFALHERHKADLDPALVRLRNEAHGQFVPHSGAIEAPLVALVGEAPGRTEHRTGRPFAGAAGRVLDDLLKHISLPRDRCYITNAVHYRPVDRHGMNRTPFPEEIEAAKRYLVEELYVVRPLVVVTLGKVPMSALVKTNARIGDCHGMVARIELSDVKFCPTMTLYHPAVGVYQKQLMPTLEHDMDGLAKLIRARNGGAW